MKTRWVMCFGLLVILFGICKSNILASGFNIKSIGSVDTSGQQLSHWWYTSSNPTIVGEAPSGSSVSISIDGTDTTVTADGSNNWSYTTGTLSEGDHTIVVSNNGSTIKFTLTIGTNNVNWEAVEKGPSQTLPTVGIILPTAILSISGLGFLFAAKKVVK